MGKIEVEILGISATPTTGGAYSLLLKEIGSERVLPIIIGPFEAQAIALEMEGVKPVRPLTHDLLRIFIEQVGVIVNEVFIDELRDNTFYAKIIIEYASLTDEIDARPSDAIALAVRVGCPIYVNEEVLKIAGIIANQGNEMDIEGSEENIKDTPKSTRISSLKDQLREALDKEEYERAAKLRDMIQNLEGKN
ncbi:MAG: bifunctional nuclease family protein [Ignavibacteriales bacterium]|nr:bifunctional nuclease family protein [Ignavibacteriales bacterium]